MPNPTLFTLGRSLAAAGLVLVASTAVVAPSATAARREIPPALGTSAAFSVLAGSAATNTGPSVIDRDVGVSPGTSITGFGSPATVGGTFHSGDAVAAAAEDDARAAFVIAADEPSTSAVPADLADLILPPGVYTAPTLGISSGGTLTLDNTGDLTDPDAVWIFQATLSTLITGSGATVALLDPSRPIGCRVFWQVSSSATLGTGTAFVGTILADQSITLDTGATIDGRLLALEAAVTLDTNTISGPSCPATVPPTTTTTTGPTTSTTATTAPTTTTTTTGASTSTTAAPATTAPTTTSGSTAPTAPTSSIAPTGSTASTASTAATTATTARNASTPTTRRASAVRSSGGASSTAAGSQLPATGFPTKGIVSVGLLTALTGLVLLLVAQWRTGARGRHHRPRSLR